jgi:drug/metabolite transporter (DMT)-like permease
MQSVRLRGNLVTIVSMAMWATTFPVTEIILETWHPVLVTGARVLIAGAFLALWMALAGRLGELRTAPWASGMLVGGVGLTGASLCLVWGLQFSDPVTASIIAATVPLIAAIMGVASRTERLTVPISVGIVLAIGGGIVTSWRDDVELLGFHGGEALVILGNVFWVWYSRGCIHRLAALSDLAKTTLTTLCCSVVVLALIVAFLATGWVPAELDLSLPTLSLIFWMAAIANGASVVFWLWGARLLGVTIGSMHQNLVPFYVMLMVLPLGGELHTQQLLGGTLVVAGAILAQLPWRRGWNLRRRP